MRGDEQAFPPAGLSLLLLHPDADHGGHLRAHSAPARQKGISSDQCSDPGPICLLDINNYRLLGRIWIRYSNASGYLFFYSWKEIFIYIP